MKKNRAFIIESPDGPWGDYWDILANGLAYRGLDDEEPLELERAGPFMPPITFPGLADIIITGECRNRLENSGLTGFEFKNVIKMKVVKIKWDEWDREAEEPKRYPAGGEPENYIDRRKHSQEAADGLGELWELRLSCHCSVVDKENRIIRLAKKIPVDLFRLDGSGYAFVSFKAKEWFEKNYPKWVSFREISALG